MVTEFAVQNIERDEPSDGFRVIASESRSLFASNLVLTTGGRSYPGCGTTGDGYAWAEQFGHTIVPTVPALVPITLSDSWVTDLSGLTLPEAAVEISIDDKLACRNVGSLLFTHFGISGPAALDASRAITKADSMRGVSVSLDLAASLSPEELQQTLRRQDNAKRTVVSIVSEFLPRRLAQTVCGNAQVAVDQRLAELSRKANDQLLRCIKSMPVNATGTLGFEKAEVTTGGVCLQSVDAKTMQSKHVPGLYFAGEILDLDGPIGGYNFQAAFSTGWLAGKSIRPRSETV